MGFQNRTGTNETEADVLEALSIDIPTTPEHTLFKEILIRALCDIIFEADIERKYRRSAIRWIFQGVSNERKHIAREKKWFASFTNVCINLDICPTLIRDRLLLCYPQKVREAQFKEQAPLTSGSVSVAEAATLAVRKRGSGRMPLPRSAPPPRLPPPLPILRSKRRLGSPVRLPQSLLSFLSTSEPEPSF